MKKLDLREWVKENGTSEHAAAIRMQEKKKKAAATVIKNKQRKKEIFSIREIEEMMGRYQPTLQRRKGSLVRRG
jgi:hypothetical protein